MLAVASHPFLGHDPRREPQPESHRHRNQCVKLHATMCLVTVEKERHADVGDVAGDDDEYDWYPPVRCPAGEIQHPRTPPCDGREMVRNGPVSTTARPGPTRVI